MNASAVTALSAPRWRRFAALGYDLLAVVAVIMVTVMACLLATRGHLDPGATWYRLTLLAAAGAYFVLSWWRRGQTLGMRAWRIRLCGPDARRPGAGRALARFALAATPLALLALQVVAPVRVALLAPLVAWTLDFAVVLLDARGRALHDLLAGTEIRRVR